MTPFECEWRGNPLLEVGDKIAMITKDNETAISFLLDDSTEFDGGMKAKSRWAYVDNSGESHSNPVSLGETLKKTYAKVDKINKEVEIVADETATLKINANLISSSVSELEKNVDSSVEELTKKVEATMTSEQVEIKIQEELKNGAKSITTSTGFTFNENGLTVSKSDSEISTTITEDGMTINKDNETMLKADNVGVAAANLHATTYLIVGKNSRFEDFDENRTGCFWIGG